MGRNPVSPSKTARDPESDIREADPSNAIGRGSATQGGAPACSGEKREAETIQLRPAGNVSRPPGDCRWDGNFDGGDGGGETAAALLAAALLQCPQQGEGPGIILKLSQPGPLRRVAHPVIQCLAKGLDHLNVHSNGGAVQCAQGIGAAVGEIEVALRIGGEKRLAVGVTGNLGQVGPPERPVGRGAEQGPADQAAMFALCRI